MNPNEDSSNALPERRKSAQKTLICDIDSDTSRINVIGIAVSTKPLVIDDGTGQINIRTQEDVKVGETLMIIGRAIALQSDTCIVPEIVKKLPDAGWLGVRKKELEKAPKVVKQKVEPIVAKIEEHDNDTHADLLLLIKKLDKGDGVDIDELISQSSVKDCQPLIDHFIRCGEVFEVAPGRIKVLE